MLTAIIVSLLAGSAIVLSRTVNAALAKETSILTSTFYNFFVGLIVAAVVCVLMGRRELAHFPGRLSPDLFIYLGGFLGVITVFLLNVTVTKISSFYMTLFVFVGQIFTGILLDAVLTHSFSVQQIFGGMFVAIGLSINLFIDKSPSKETATP